MRKGKGFLGKRFVLTAGVLLAVFAFFAFGYDVSKLEVILPSILLFYHGADAYENIKIKENKTNGSQ